MAKEVSQEKLDKIKAKGSKKRAAKETRQSNRVKKLAARKGISEGQAKEVKANRKQIRKEKFETAMGIREGVTTQKYKPTAWSANKYATSFQNMADTKFNTSFSKNKLSENAKLRGQEQNESPVGKIVTPFTMKTSCKY